MRSAALTSSDEPDAQPRAPENVLLSERTKAAPSQTRPLALLAVSDSPVRLALPRSQRPQLGAQIIPFAIPSSAPTLDGGFSPADHPLLAEVHDGDLAHIPAFLLRPFGLGKPPAHRGET